MIDWIRRLWAKEGIRYLFFGGCTTVFSTAIFWACTSVLSVPYLWANVISWVLAVVIAFLVNKLFVFNSTSWDARVFREAGLFFLSRLFTLVLGEGVLYAGVEWLLLHELLAKILSQFVEITANYILSKIVVFVRKKPGWSDHHTS